VGSTGYLERVRPLILSRQETELVQREQEIWVLFRTNETAFVQTKRKLLEECSVDCIVSLPGGVFSSAGAGVKTNLVFFSKGEQTERVWYYVRSSVPPASLSPRPSPLKKPFTT
jgi:N-6 DNA Methylase